MKKLIAVVLVIITLSFSLSGCQKRLYESGKTHITIEFSRSVNAKVEADKLIFNKNDTTVDLLYCLYNLDYVTIEQIKKSYCYIPTDSELKEGIKYTEAAFAIYISNNEELIFEEEQSIGLIDYENKVNAKLVKYITFEEAFENDHGFTTSRFKIDYHHSEKFTIPAEMFDSSNDCVYIHLVRLNHCPEDNTYYLLRYYQCTVKIKYKLIGKDNVILLNDIYD